MADLQTIRNELVAMANRIGSQQALAEQIGVSKSFLCKVVRGRKKPTMAILSALGYREVVVVDYVKEEQE